MAKIKIDRQSGAFCPHCGSPDWVELTEGTGEQAISNGRCWKCGGTWLIEGFVFEVWSL